MLKLIWRIILWGGGLFVAGFVLLFGYAALTERTPTFEETAGTYVFDYPHGLGREVYVLRLDGSFNQTLHKDGKLVYTSTGTWKMPPGEVELTLEPWWAVDYMQSRNGKPEFFGIGHPYRDRRHEILVINEDERIVGFKQRPQP